MPHTTVRWDGHVKDLATYAGVDAFVAAGGWWAALVDVTGREIRRLGNIPSDKVVLAGDRAILGAHQAVHAVDIATGELAWTIAADSGAHLAVGGDTLVTVSYGGYVRTWDVATGAARAPLALTALASVLVHADGTRIVTAENTGHGGVWNAVTGECIARFTADHLFGFLDDDHVLGCHRGGAVSAWRLSDGHCLFTRTLPALCMPAAVLLPDGKRFLYASYDLHKRPLEVTFTLHDLARDHSTNVIGWSDPANRLEPYRITPLAGERAIATTREGAVVALDLGGGPSCVLGAHAGSVSAAIAVGGHAVTCSRETLIIWDLDAPVAVAHTAKVTAILPRLDDVITTSDDGTLRRWVGDRVTHAWSAGRGRISSAAIAPDGSVAACMIDEPALRLWDLAHGTYRTVQGATSPIGPPTCVPNPGFYAKLGSAWRIAITPDGRVLMPVADHLTVWDLAGTLLAQRDCGSQIDAVAAHPDGRHAITVGGYELQFWNFETERVRTSKLATVTSAIAASGDTLVVGVGDKLEIWDLARERCAHVLAAHTAAITTVATDGTRALSGDDTGLLVLWDLAARRESARWQTQQRITACALLADGRIARGDATGAFAVLSA